MDRNVTVPGSCKYCGSAVMLTVADWPTGLALEVLETREVPERYRRAFACPVCRIDNGIGLPGRLISVSAAHTD